MGRHVNRPAGKRRIAKALKDYKPWRDKINARAAAMPAWAQPTVKEWADDVHSRIQAGDLGVCNQALIRSVMRLCEDVESGRYIGMTSTGGFRCASYQDAGQ